MKITDEALDKIKSSLVSNPGKLPRIVLKRGGCAGNILVLLLGPSEPSDKLIEIRGVTFALTAETYDLVDNIVIGTKPGLIEEIIVRSENLQTCKCGKSFRL